MFNIRIAFILALLLFYLFHYSLFNIKILIWGGIYLWIFEKTGTVICCILAHIISNININIDYLLWITNGNDNIENTIIIISFIAIFIYFIILLLQRNIAKLK